MGCSRRWNYQLVLLVKTIEKTGKGVTHKTNVSKVTKAGNGAKAA